MFGIGGVNHGGRAETLGTTYTAGTTVAGTTVTAGATANTKGAWAALGTPSFQYECFTLIVCNIAASHKSIDVGVDDGAGNYHVIAEDISFPAQKYADIIMAYNIPVRVKPGRQVGVRCQATTASHTLNVALLGFSRSASGASGYSAMRRINAVTTSRGTTIDPGATALTKGAWTQLVAATAANYSALAGVVGQAGDTGRATAATALFDVGLGSAGNEVPLVSDVFLRWSSTSDGPVLIFGPLPVQVPAGARLAARAACSDATAGDRTFDLSLYGFTP